MADSQLDAHCWARIYSHSTFEEVNAAMCASKHWQAVLQDEQIWQQLLKRDWGLTFACDTNLEPISSFRQSYKIWQTQFGYYQKEKRVVAQMAMTWKSLTGWYQQHLPQILDTLLPGLSERQIDERLPRDGGNFPLTLRMFYRFCGGQKKGIPPLCGMFGGASFYHDMPMCRLIPFEQINVYSQAGLGHFIPFAVIDFSSAAMCCACTTGQVAVHSQRASNFPASPKGKTFADWLETFANRLLSGVYEVRELLMQETARPHLSLYPRTEIAGMREAITEGLRVRVSTLFLPEKSYRLPGRSQFFYTYSVQFWLLPVEEQEAYWPTTKGSFVPKKEVRLETRSWFIYDDQDQLIDQVSGEGVVGFFPELEAGGEPFEYQSCTPTATEHASMGGYFSFTANHTSSRLSFLDAKCPRFALDVPDYSFC